MLSTNIRYEKYHFVFTNKALLSNIVKRENLPTWTILVYLQQIIVNMKKRRIFIVSLFSILLSISIYPANAQTDGGYIVDVSAKNLYLAYPTG